jgi:hypothetical protein
MDCFGRREPDLMSYMFIRKHEAAMKLLQDLAPCFVLRPFADGPSHV